MALALPFTLLQEWTLQEQQGTLFLLLLLFLTLFYLLKFRRTRRLNLPPSPFKLPIIGNLHQLGTLPHRSLHALSKKFGPLMLLHLGHAPTLVVSSAELATEIMKTNDIVFANRPMTTAAKAMLYGCRDVGFSPYGEYWRQVRKICVLELLSVNKVQSLKYVREEEVVVMIENISPSCASGATINLSEILLSISNNIVCRSVLGRKYEEKEGKSKFGELSREVTEYFGVFSFGDFFPSLGWMDVLTGLAAKLNKAFRALDAFFEQVIEEHLNSERDNEDDEKKDFVDILLHVQKCSMLDIKLTRDNIKAIIMDMFVAGTDTTSTTLEWTMAELINNPNIMKKSQEEVRKVVGKKSRVDENDVKQMQYLKSVVKESLRLHAPVPLLLPRESYAGTKVGDYNIPPNTRAYINVWAIQRDPNLWDNPEEFLPERFANKPIDLKGQDFQFMAFGAGRRGCPGISFGLASVEFVLANLLYWFDWELPGGAIKEDLDMTETFGITVCKKNPLHLVPMHHSS